MSHYQAHERRRFDSFAPSDMKIDGQWEYSRVLRVGLSIRNAGFSLLVADRHHFIIVLRFSQLVGGQNSTKSKSSHALGLSSRRSSQRASMSRYLTVMLRMVEILDYAVTSVA